jgi:aspartate oxidase
MPAAHFTMGGIEIDEHGGTGVEGLFAAGEVTSGLHGANRMGGNALSETLVFGARAGVAAAARARSASSAGRIAVGQPAEASSSGSSPLKVLERLKENLWKHCGPVRTRDGLARGIEILGRLEEEKLSCRSTADVVMAASLQNGFLTARKILDAALSRQASLGAHYRED